jgi:hypothetical protein
VIIIELAAAVQQTILLPGGRGGTFYDVGVLKVLELGAGTGLVGVAAARLLMLTGPATPTPTLVGGEVIISDVAEVVPQLQKTIEVNTGALNGAGGDAGAPLPARAAALDWTKAAADLAAIHRGTFEAGAGAGVGGASAANTSWDLILAADVVWVEHLITAFADVRVLVAPRFDTRCCARGRFFGWIPLLLACKHTMHMLQ